MMKLLTTFLIVGISISGISGTISITNLNVSNLVITSWSNVMAPAGWTWDIPFTIEQQGTNFRPKNFDLFSYSMVPSNGKAYYVSPSGSDSAAGTNWQTALASIATANNKPDIVICYVSNGFYNILKASGGGNAKAIIGVGGIATNSHDWTYNTGWSAATNHWVRSIGASSIGSVWDFLYTTNGAPIIYTNLATVSAVDSTPGSWIKDASNVLNINTLDNRNPSNSNMRIFINGNNNYALTGTNTYYFENICFEGCGNSQRLFRGFTQTSTSALKIYATNCLFMCSPSPYDLVTMLGTTESIFWNCTACSGCKDVFNYTPANGINPESIEIGCEGFMSGDPSQATHNASTSHGGSKIVRIKGRYHHTYGPTVADVGTNTLTWNLGVEAYSTICPSVGLSRSSFYVDTGATNWLDHCYSHDVPAGGQDVVAGAPGDKTNWRFQVGNTTGGTGSIVDY